MLAAAKGVSTENEPDSGVTLSNKTMETFANLVAIASRNTIDTVNKEITNVRLQMKTDKDDIMQEIDIKNAANRDEINKDVRRQINDIEKKRMEDRQVDLTFKKKLEEMERQRLLDR